MMPLEISKSTEVYTLLELGDFLSSSWRAIPNAGEKLAEKNPPVKFGESVENLKISECFGYFLGFFLGLDLGGENSWPETVDLGHIPNSHGRP